MYYNYTGINFLGKLHNTKQHIQFIKDEIIIPDDILPKFLTTYNLNICNNNNAKLLSEPNEFKKII